jgi:endonuclease/exonuclease/phosphatase family metal-dependent hydrolase
MSFSVLHWNVWYKETNQNIVDFLKATNADILCLQELTIEGDGPRHLPRYLAAQLGYNAYFKVIDLGPGKIDLANGIFSRYQVSDGESMCINEPTGGGGYDDEYRALVQATVKVDGREVRVGTTHMSYTDQFEATFRKSSETDRLLGAVRGHKANFILTGDLNAVPGSYTVKRLESRFVNASPSYDVPTWTTKPFSYRGFEESELKWRLDYIFSTEDLKVLSTDVLSTDYSDHLPILTVFD